MSQKQTQSLSPQMMQSMEVLQMGSQELLEYIEEAVQENPVLEPEENYDKQDEFSILRRKLEWLESTDPQNRSRIRRKKTAPCTTTAPRKIPTRISIITFFPSSGCWSWMRPSWPVRNFWWKI